MDPMTRRRFLRASGVVGAGALAAGAAGIGISELLSTSTPETREQAPTHAKLVIVTLYGGNDGLNTVIPYADPAYYRARPELAYPQEKVLRLDTALALNPVLPGLHRLWQSRQLAIVAGVGYPRPDRSHFRSMDIWQTANPARPVRTGWVGRWLDGTAAPVEAAVSFESVLPPLLAGATRSGACISVGGLALPSSLTTTMIGALGQPQPGESALQARAALSYADLVKMDTMVREASAATSSPSAASDHPPATGTGGSNSLAAQLGLVARCVEAGVPTSVYSVSLGGFDTHAQERVGHEMLLRELDTALTSFVDRMATTANGQRVSVLVYSEFGRRVRANSSDGTDHGTAGPVFVAGPRVAGGLYGEQPGLRDLDDGDLKATMDFRDVLGAALSTVLGAEPARYLDGYQPKTPLPIFAPV
ncbi:Uncharacterized conserved protein, DUF1501 family [Asanoa hainanensis]|uniref:Uncharacterized conserved protein, DUF1501 family n=2 Tax=Asanoa hainanensis TaxID=560556 RepID=A0A239GTM8_9ACTN|nr:DUF1501 domain-containing protein [Asanoa hainanensis]SNS72477.1 Uncharacterized conserved protein, DUF1501 family [Asanoa hainanensis]